MRILYTTPENTLSVIHAAKKSDIEKVLGELTDEQYKAHVWSKSVPKDAVNPVEITDEYVLPDREFRNAWSQNGKLVEHDLEKARTIQLERIRAAREPKLTKLDRDYMRADELGDDVTKRAVATEKQVLRDITKPLIDLKPGSIEDIKDAFPESLKETALKPSD